MGKTRMPRHGPGIRIQSPAPTSRHLHGRLVTRIFAAALATTLVTTGPAHDLAGSTASAHSNRQSADSHSITGVVGPIKALLDHDRGLGPLAILWLGHPFGRRQDLVDVDTGYLCCIGRLELVLGQQPFLPIIEAVGLKLSPSSAPLPWRVPGTLAEARGGFPLVVDPVFDPIGILPIGLNDNPGNGVDYQQIRADINVEPKATILLCIGYAGSTPRDHHDAFLTVLNALHDPLSPKDRLGFVWICAADQQGFCIHPVFVGGSKVIETSIAEARRRGDVRRRIMEGKVCRVDVTQGVFGDGVSVLDILIREGLHAVGIGTVLGTHVVANLGRHVQGEVPWHRLQDAVDPHHG